ncbi:alpha/beta hydrolase [Streptomyces sp. NPDC055681]
MAAHAAEVDVVPERFTVAGDSAGGTLAALVALRARDRGDPKLFCRSSCTTRWIGTWPPDRSWSCPMLPGWPATTSSTCRDWPAPDSRIPPAQTKFPRAPRT